MSLFAQLALIAHLSPATTINIVPLINILWLIGRIAFMYGYPERRFFGFFIGGFPTAGVTIAAIYYLLVNQIFGY